MPLAEQHATASTLTWVTPCQAHSSCTVYSVRRSGVCSSYHARTILTMTGSRPRLAPLPLPILVADREFVPVEQAPPHCEWKLGTVYYYEREKTRRFTTPVRLLLLCLIFLMFGIMLGSILQVLG